MGTLYGENGSDYILDEAPKYTKILSTIKESKEWNDEAALNFYKENLL